MNWTDPPKYLFIILVALTIVFQGCTDYSDESGLVDQPETRPLGPPTRVHPVIKGKTISVNLGKLIEYLEHRFERNFSIHNKEDREYILRIDSIAYIVLNQDSIPSKADWLRLQSISKRILAKGWRCNNQPQPALRASKVSVQSAIDIDDDRLMASAWEELGQAYIFNRYYDSAVYAFDQSVTLYDGFHDDHTAATCLFHIARALVELGKPAEALTRVTVAREHVNYCRDNTFLLLYADVMAHLFARVSENDSAEFFFSYGLDISESTEDTVSQLTFIARLAQLDFIQSEFHNALARTHSGLHILRNVPVNDGRHNVYLLQRNELLNTAGSSHFHLGEYEQALGLFNKAIDDLPRETSDFEKAQLYTLSAWCKLYLGHPDDAIKLGREGETFARKANLPQFLMSSYMLLARATEQIGDHKKSVHYQNKAIAINDSVNPLKLYTDFISTHQQLAYDHDVFALEAERNHEKEALLKANQDEQSKTWGIVYVILILSGGVGAMGFIGFLIYSNNQNRKELALMKAHEVERERREVAESKERLSGMAKADLERKVKRTELQLVEMQAVLKEKEAIEQELLRIKEEVRDVLKEGLKEEMKPVFLDFFRKQTNGAKIVVRDDEWFYLDVLMRYHDQQISKIGLDLGITQNDLHTNLRSVYNLLLGESKGKENRKAPAIAAIRQALKIDKLS